MIDYYAVLGVATSASPQEIRTAFLTLAKATHPDHHPGDRAKEARFKEVTAAYEVLSDPAARAAHDRERMREQHVKPPAAPTRATSSNADTSASQPARTPPTPPPQRAPIWVVPPPPPSPPSGLGTVLGVLGIFGLAAIAATAIDERRTRWDANVRRRRGRDGQFRPHDSWW